MSIKEHAEELGYTHNCRGCGQKSDTPWCGCSAGEPEETDEERLERKVDETRRYDAAAALRQLADLLEDNPHMQLPYEGFGGGAMLFMCHDKQSFAATVKAFGKGSKGEDEDATCLTFEPTKFPLRVKVFGFKSSICEKRKITREVPETVIAAVPARPAFTIPAHSETVTEYVCEPSFLAVPRA